MIASPSMKSEINGREAPHVVVVGAGLAGLSAAVELTTLGAKVTIVDKNEHLGGKMNVLREEGFAFDMGPTIITLPQVLRGVVERSGRTLSDYITLVDLDPQWRCFYEDGAVINLWKDPQRLASDLNAQFPETKPGAGYLKFLEFARRMYRLSEKVFFYRDVAAVGDVMRQVPPTDFALVKEVLGMRMHSTVGATAHHWIEDRHTRQLCEHFLQYVGSSPFLAPAILSLIASAQVDQGCWYPMGGTREVARTLERILREEHAQIITGAKVKRIAREGGRATKVILEDGREIACDAVVSNCDVQRTMLDLLGGRAGEDDALRRQQDIAKRYEPACSGVVLYLGLNRRYEHLAHHNFLFSKDSHAEFDDIYTRGEPARDPTLYLAVPSRTDEAQAPPGCEALYVLVHTPYRRDRHAWTTGAGGDPGGFGAGPLLRSYRETIVAKLKRFGMEDIEEHIVVERALTPSAIDTMYNAEGGAIYGLASHGKLSGGFKPSNRSRVAPNVYIAGGSANPGPGVPMVLMSGVTAARVLGEDFGLLKKGEAALAMGERVKGVPQAEAIGASV